ncbi:hypothetical protein [Guptibacillus algicola]|uniref:hypothetical protein n=1 Tax=Guptibacillus algicola TaxID=225844 RepID=UPI001CD25B41|nr:hypothetical protein [Alkalihalobacillus algicola]MCA0988508.1 hypothetical protein [Alkalihalobacillus algicola]
MALSIAITISIILLHLSIFQHSKHSFLDNSIVFFVVSIFIMNYLTIIAWNKEFIAVSTDDSLFVSFLLHRNLITPLLIVLFANTFRKQKGVLVKVGLLASTLLIMYLFNFGSVYFDVENYKEWNLLLASMMDFIVLTIGVVTLHFVVFLKTKETQNYGGL